MNELIEFCKADLSVNRFFTINGSLDPTGREQWNVSVHLGYGYTCDGVIVVDTHRWLDQYSNTMESAIEATLRNLKTVRKMARPPKRLDKVSG